MRNHHWTELKPLDTNFGERMTDGNIIEDDFRGMESIEDAIMGIIQKIPAGSSSDDVIDLFITEGFIHPEWKNTEILKDELDDAISYGGTPSAIYDAIYTSINEIEVNFLK